MTSARRLYLQVEQSWASTFPGESTTLPCARATAWPPVPFAVACCVIPPDRSGRPSSQSDETLKLVHMFLINYTDGFLSPLMYKSTVFCCIPRALANADVDNSPFTSETLCKK